MLTRTLINVTFISKLSVLFIFGTKPVACIFVAADAMFQLVSYITRVVAGTNAVVCSGSSAVRYNAVPVLSV